MNGAAMDFGQDHQKAKSSGLHMPSTPLPHNSKAMNHPSDPYVDLELWKNREPNGSNFRNRSPPEYRSDFMSRRRPRTPVREPMELPVPQFEIDENYVGEIPNTKMKSLAQNSKDLDLDTRINLLIKSKALSGMHPIFSDLSESEDFSHSSDDSLTEFPMKSKHELSSREFSPQGKIPSQESFDNPETPLSRPPSPFLSRATYLFWFNKAIELKQQAKAQEKALIEEATKKLLKNNSAEKLTNQESAQHDSDLLKSLLGEVGKELKEAIKEHFLNQIIESAAFDCLESWWEDQKVLQGKCQDTLTTEESEDVQLPSSNDVSKSDAKEIPPRSTSPKEPFPWKITNSESEETINVTDHSSHEEKVLRNTIVHYPLSEDSELSKNSQKEDDDDSKIAVSPVREESVLNLHNKTTAENEEKLDMQQAKNITTEDVGSISCGEKEVLNEDIAVSKEISTLPSNDNVSRDSKCYNSEISVDEHKPIENLDLEVKCPDSIQKSLSLENSCRGLIKTEELVSSTSLPESETETSELKDKSSQILNTIEDKIPDKTISINCNSPIKN